MLANLFFVILAGVSSYIFLVKLVGRWQLIQKLDQFTGPRSIPLFGNALDFNVHKREILNVLKKWKEQYGSRYKIFLGLQPYLIICNASDVEKILSSQTQIEKSEDYELIHPWLGISLLTSGGKRWSHRRKQLTPAFHFQILGDILKVFNGQCKTFIQVLEEKRSKPFDIFPTITALALDIICEAAMGCTINAQKQSDSDYVKAVYRMTEIVQYRLLRPWLIPDITWNFTMASKEQKRCLKILHGFVESVIKKRKKERENLRKNEATKNQNITNDGLYSKKRLAFLDLLLEAQETDPTLTDLNIREETDTFMFEGHDTTSSAASWTTFLLACNPESQAKVHQELDRIFGDDKDRDVTLADAAEMKYLECCIKEGLRIYPSVPFIGRKLTKDLELADGSVVPVGCIIWNVFYLLHRDAKVFPDPERFDPDRFLPENVKGRNPFAYTPFSAGPRNCIGQKFALLEEKVILSSIFRKFKVVAVDKRDDVAVLCELILRPENGLYVKLEKR